MVERRTKQQIYLDILSAIENESTDEKIKLTRVQLSSKISYDKAKKHLESLEKYKMVESKPVIKITSKGKEFIEDVQQIQTNLKIIDKAYLSDSSKADEYMLIMTQIKDSTKYFLYDQKNNQTVEYDIIHKLKEQKQIQNAMQAIIDELG